MEWYNSSFPHSSKICLSSGPNAGFSKRNKLKSTSLKGLGDLLEIPPPGADLHLRALHLECPLPTAECLGLRMHVTKKNACARPGNSIDLTGEGFQVFQGS